MRKTRSLSFALSPRAVLRGPRPLRAGAVRRFAAACLLAMALLAPDAAATNGARPISYGPRAGGRGGVDTAFADDATAINTNPAGIAFIDGQRLDSLMTWVHPTVGFETPVDDGESTRNGFAGSFAVAFDFDEPWHVGEALTFEDSGAWVHAPRTSPDYGGSGWKFGFGIFPVKGAVLKMHATTPFWDEDPVTGLPEERQQWAADVKEVAFAVAAAYRPVHWISFGIAPQFIYGEINQNQPLAAPVSVLQGHPFDGDEDLTYARFAPFLGQTHIVGATRIHHARTYGARIRAGILVQPTDWFSVGLSYASQTLKQDYLGTVELDFTRQIEKIERDPGTPISLKAVIGANTGNTDPDDQTYFAEYDFRAKPLDEPQEVSLGVAFRFPYVAFGMDITWINWSATYDNLETRLTNGTSPELNELTGDTSSTTHPSVPVDWDDQVVIGLGLAVAPTDWLVVRAGYNYGKSPVPDETLQPTTPAITEHHATAGISVLVRRLEFTLNYEHDFRAKQRSDENAANPDLSGTEVDLQIQFISFGISARF